MRRRGVYRGGIPGRGDAEGVREGGGGVGRRVGEEVAGVGAESGVGDGGGGRVRFIVGGIRCTEAGGAGNEEGGVDGLQDCVKLLREKLKEKKVMLSARDQRSKASSKSIPEPARGLRRSGALPEGFRRSGAVYSRPALDVVRRRVRTTSI